MSKHESRSWSSESETQTDNRSNEQLLRRLSDAFDVIMGYACEELPQHAEIVLYLHKGEASFKLSSSEYVIDDSELCDPDSGAAGELVDRVEHAKWLEKNNGDPRE